MIKEKFPALAWAHANFELKCGDKKLCLKASAAYILSMLVSVKYIKNTQIKRKTIVYSEIYRCISPLLIKNTQLSLISH